MIHQLQREQAPQQASCPAMHLLQREQAPDYCWEFLKAVGAFTSCESCDFYFGLLFWMVHC
jgi:hypothetical protein